MIDKIISMYITLIPPILAGIANMIWCKANILKKINKPIDFGKSLKDGKRLFGDNKTWKGFLGYIVLNMIITIIVGLICIHNEYLQEHNFLYAYRNNTILYNTLIGIGLGLGYALFELPNSFLKRRLSIVPGKRANGKGKYFFAILDQADSVFGCVLVVCLVYKMSIGMFFSYVLLGTLTHLILNVLLYLAHLRKNII